MTNNPDNIIPIGEIDAKLKLEFLIEGVRRAATELLDLSRKPNAPTKKELLTIGAMIAFGIAIVTDMDIPDITADTGETSGDVVGDARKLLSDLQKEANQENQFKDRI